MTIFSKKFLCSFIVLATFAVSPAQAQSFTDAQKEEIGAVIKSYLVEHPEVVMDALNAHQANQAKAEEEKAAAALEGKMGELTAAGLPGAGNPEGDVTVVEFFDYNCGYCKRAIPDVLDTLKDDPNVRFVFHEMPILGPTSMTASQWALAAHKQGKYFDFHKALMEHQGQVDENLLTKIAEDLKLDVAKMKTDAASEEVKKEIEASIAVAQELGINGTPAFLVNKTIARGYMGPEGLQKAIEQEREKEKP